MRTVFDSERTCVEIAVDGKNGPRSGPYKTQVSNAVHGERPMTVRRELHSAARDLAEQLARARVRLVLAESCTAGLVAALLGEIPGISEWWCGSAVVYREATKTAWLGVAPRDLAKFTAVSAEVARGMACGALERTPEADVAVAVTGHLGPASPAGQDGLVFVGSAVRRTGSASKSRTSAARPSAVRPIVQIEKLRLAEDPAESVPARSAKALRLARRNRVTLRVLQHAARAVEAAAGTRDA